MTEPDKMQQATQALEKMLDRFSFVNLGQSSAADSATRNSATRNMAYDAVKALQVAIARPTASQPLTDKSINAMWSNDRLTLPQLVNRRVTARAVEAAHAIAQPADLPQEDGAKASNLPVGDSPQG